MDTLQQRRQKMKWYNGVQLLSHLRSRGLGLPITETYDLCERNRQQTLYQKDVKGHYGCVNAVEFSPRGDFIVSGGDDLRVVMWKAVDFLTNDQSKPFRIMKNRHLSNIFALGVSLNTERIFSGGNDHTLIVHDIVTGDDIQSYTAERCFYGISIHPHDDNVFSAASEDGRVRIYDLRNSEECHAIKQDGPVFCGAYNPIQSNLMCVCGSKMGLTVYDHRMLKEAYASAGNFTQNAIHGDWNDVGGKIFCIRSKNSPLVFDLRSSNHIELNDEFYSNVCTVKSCTFIGSEYVMTGSDDWNIYIWKVPEFIDDDLPSIDEAFTVLKGHRSIVNHIRYSPENNIIVSCGVEKILKNPDVNDRLFTYADDIDNIDEDLQTLQMFDYFAVRERDNRDGSDQDSEMETSEDEREVDGLMRGYVIRFAHHADGEDYENEILSSSDSSANDMDNQDEGSSEDDSGGFHMFES